MLTPEKVLPAIFKLENNDTNPPSITSDGWHHLRELLEVVNYLLARKEMAAIGSGAKLVATFYHLKKFPCFIWFNGQRAFQGDLVNVTQSVCKNTDGIYVPAGWGLAVIGAVDMGVCQIRILASEHPSVVGTTQEGEDIVLDGLVPGKKFT